MYNSLKPYDKITKKYISILIVTNLVSSILMLVFPASIQILIDKLLPIGNTKYILLWVIFFITTSCLISLFNFFFVEYLGDKAATIIANSIRKKLIQKILNIPVYTYNKFDGGMLFNTVISETNMAAAAFCNNKILFVTKIIQVVIYVVIVFFINWQIGILTVLVSPIFMFFSFKNQNNFEESIKEERKKVDNLVNIANVIFKNQKQISIYNKSKYFSNKFNCTVDEWGESRIHYNFYYTFLKAIPNLLNELTIILIYGLGCLFIIKNTISLGTLLLLTQICVLLFQQLSTIVSIKIDVKNTIPLFERIDSILFTDIESNDIADGIISEKLQLRNIDIKVNNRVLFNIDEFIIDTPGISRLSAENGSGKTYFIDSILGLVKGIEKKTTTEINIPNAVDMGYFCNSTFFMEDTVVNNIFLGDKYSQEFINEMSDLFDLKFINKEITLAPLNLSLGEQQKVCLMRFFWSNREKSYWFIDEPLSNLDIKTIYKLCEYIQKKSNVKKILVISHDEYFKDIANCEYRIENYKLVRS